MNHAGNPQDSSLPHATAASYTKQMCAVVLCCLQDISHSRFVLTSEAQAYLTAGSPEVQLFNAVPADGITLAQLKVRCFCFCCCCYCCCYCYCLIGLVVVWQCAAAA
jgi:hypothetical protein